MATTAALTKSPPASPTPIGSCYCHPTNAYSLWCGVYEVRGDVQAGIAATKGERPEISTYNVSAADGRGVRIRAGGAGGGSKAVVELRGDSAADGTPG